MGTMLVICQGRLHWQLSLRWQPHQGSLCFRLPRLSGMILESCCVHERILVYKHNVVGCNSNSRHDRSLQRVQCTACFQGWDLLMSCSADSPGGTQSSQNAGPRPSLWDAVPPRSPPACPFARSLASSQWIFLAPQLDHSRPSGSLKKKRDAVGLG